MKARMPAPLPTLAAAATVTGEGDEVGPVGTGAEVMAVVPDKKVEGGGDSVTMVVVLLVNGVVGHGVVDVVVGGGGGGHVLV